jgi:cytochrome c peroxidase
MKITAQVVLTAAVSVAHAAPEAFTLPIAVTPNETGIAMTVTTNRQLIQSRAFFQSLGTNGRACVHCHQPDAAWSITPAGLQRVFDRTAGLDPVFRTNDGSNSPRADVSTVQKRREAYSMLLNKAVIRVGLSVPQNAEFELVNADDPYSFASARELSLFRRPLPGTNVRFVSAVMWDGRETLDPIKDVGTLKANLKRQAVDATLGHAQAALEPKPEQVDDIVEFVFGLHTTQMWDRSAGTLNARGADGSPSVLASQDFYIGINDPIGMNPKGTPFDPVAMRIFGAWKDISEPGFGIFDFGNFQERNAARQAVARGEQIFNTRAIAISNVGGLNDVLNVPVLKGTCTTCHDTPNVGNHSVSMPLNIGIADEARRTPDMPLYTLQHKGTGAVVKTMDPGRAMISGKWADVGKFKGPTLRALAARPPYFHDGSAATLADVVDFYNTRFGLNLTNQEKVDLLTFLRCL